MMVVNRDSGVGDSHGGQSPRLPSMAMVGSPHVPSMAMVGSPHRALHGNAEKPPRALHGNGGQLTLPVA